MLPPELARQIRRLHLRARRAVEDMLGGEYHSVFKGAGLSFEEVREYQPGDDVRAIDWNVTARMGHPFIKRYVEERERTVLLVADVSASLGFGTGLLTKRAAAAELAALLSFCAIHNNDRVGLIAFTGRVERFLPARKGAKHALRLVRDILFYPPAGRRTHVKAALDFLSRVQPKRAVVFLISDFLDAGYEHSLRLMARKHDLIAVRVSDPREMNLPPIGLLQVEDAETGEQRLIDTSARGASAALQRATANRREQLDRLSRAGVIDLIDVSTDGDHLDALVGFFQRRERRARRHAR